MIMGPSVDAREYLETLNDYLEDAKPGHIDVLTELAREYGEHASAIVEIIEEQIERVEGTKQVAILHLIDSILQNEETKPIYVPLFSKNIHILFANVYKQNEPIRDKLHKWRSVWNGILPQESLLALDNMVNSLNSTKGVSNSVHVNPKFLPPVAVVSSTVPQQVEQKTTNENPNKIRNDVENIKKRKPNDLQRILQNLKDLEQVRVKTADTIFASVKKFFNDWEQFKSTSSTCDLEEIRKMHARVKSIRYCVDQYVEKDPNNARFATLIKDYDALKRKFVETEIFLTELEKAYVTKSLAADKPLIPSNVPASLPVTQNEATRSSSSAINQIRTTMSNSSNVFNKVNGTLSTSQTPQNPHAFRIAPVSSELINAAAAKCARDPRLRKLNQEPSKSNNEAINENDIESTTSSQQVETKNDKRNESPEKLKPEVAKSKEKSNCELFPKKELEKRKVTMVIERKKSETSSVIKPSNPSTEKKKNESSSPEKRKLKENSSRKMESKSKSRNNYTNSAAAIEELFNETSSSSKKDKKDEKPLKTFSKEERNKRLRILREANKTEPLLEELSKNDPKAAEKLSRLINRTKDGKKRITAAESEHIEVDDSNDCIFVSAFKIPSNMSDADEMKPKPTSEIIAKLEINDKDTEEYEPVKEVKTRTVDFINNLETSAIEPLNIRALLSPTLATSSASVTVDEPPITASSSADPSSFSYPFGLSETKDVDYRLFFSLAPTLASNVTVVESEASKASPVTSSAPENTESEMKSVAKRKHTEEVTDRSKRRRTLSPSSDDDDCRRSPNANMNGHGKPSCGSDGVEMMDVSIMKRGYSERQELSSAPDYEDSDSNLVVMPTSQLRSPSNSPPPMNPFFRQNFPGFMSPSFGGVFPSASAEVPPANPDVIKMIDLDPMKTTPIDGIMREIRHYGSNAVTFLHWDDPRQISFKPENVSVPRRIVIDHKFCVPCWLNAPDVETMVFGKPHRFRFGVPTRELYIDGFGYECYFGGDPIDVELDGQFRKVRIIGQPPQAYVSPTKRPDLVAGKINMIINDEHTFPVFLDAKPQKIVVDDVTFVIMFIDALKRLCINDTPFRADFGGLPQSFKFNKKVYFFRFTQLPAGIVPGVINIYQMIMTKLPSPPPLPPSLQYSDVGSPVDFPMLPAIPPIPNVPNTITGSHEPDIGNSPFISEANVPPVSVGNLLGSLNIDELLQSLVASGIVSAEKEKEKERQVEDKTVKYVDFKKSDTLKQKQPGMISLLHSGTQCGSCGLRFPEEQTFKYSEHLDWHFRLNRRGRNGAKTIHSRKWYYNSVNWMQFQEMEDKSDRGQSWFDSHPETEYTEEVVENVPCVSASQFSQDACVLCRDKFEQFYNEDLDEWQLRNAIQIDDKLYHPICHQDHNQEKSYQSDDVEEIVDLIETRNLDSIGSEHENESELDTSEVPNTTDVAEVSSDTITKIKTEKPDVLKPIGLGSETPLDASLTTQYEDDDSDIEDVQVIEQPIEEIIIQDDANDLEEPNLETLNAGEIIAAPEEVQVPIETPVVEISEKVVDITQPTNVVSIDGNIELAEAYQQLVSGPTKIKINIAKSHTEEKIASPKNEEETRMTEETENINEQPPPPGEETMTLVPADVKARLKNCTLTIIKEPVKKGEELGGICSIM